MSFSFPTISTRIIWTEAVAPFASVPLVLSTGAARNRLGGAVQALGIWEHISVARPDGGVLGITGVPAQHGPTGAALVVGEVTGFVLDGDGLPTIYVSGDNASLDVVRTIVDRLGPVDGALLNAGAARTALMNHADLTLDSVEAAEAARMLDARWVVPLHVEGWAHFTLGVDSLRAAFIRAGMEDRLYLLRPGEHITLTEDRDGKGKSAATPATGTRA